MENTSLPDTSADALRKKLRTKVDQILKSVDTWKELWFHADKKESELLRHFNGGDLQVMSDASGHQVTYYANFNVARSRLLKIARERLQPYYSKLGIFDVKITNPKLKETPGLELACNEAMSQMLRSDGRQTPHYCANVKDAILTGRGVLWRRTPTQMVMERARLLAHPDCISAIKDDTLGEWAFRSTVRAGELHTIIKKSKDAPIREQARRVLQSIIDRNEPNGSPPNWPEEESAWEAVYEECRDTTYGATALSTAVPCYWYFEKDMSGPPGDRPVSVYCVARHGVDLSLASGDDGKVSSKRTEATHHAEGMIYRKEKAFDRAEDCTWLFTIGEEFGGQPTLGRTKGEGEIQYAADIRIQKMLNSVLGRIEVENLTLWESDGTASKSQIDDLSQNPLRDHDIIPQGIKFIERRFGDKPLSGMMQFIGLLSGYAADHAAVDTGHTDAPREENFKDQVLERLNDRVAAKTITESAWGDCLDPMAAVIGHLIFNETLTKNDEAWEFREMFFALLKEAGFDIKAADLKDGVKVTARRNPGHGDMGVAMARADANVALAQMTGPEAVQRAVFEKAVLVAGGDVQKAATLLGGIPGGPKAPDGPDVHNAQMQMAMILAAGVQLTPGPEDNPYIHTAVQMTLLESALAGYQQDGGWSQNDMRCWDAALAHSIADVTRMPLEDAKKASMKRIKAIQTTAGALPIFAQGEPPVDPVMQAKVELAAAELDRKRQKDASADAKWERTQEHREKRDGDMMALQQHTILSSNARQDGKLAAEDASRKLSDAISLNAATAPKPEPAFTP